MDRARSFTVLSGCPEQKLLFDLWGWFAAVPFLAIWQLIKHFSSSGSSASSTQTTVSFTLVCKSASVYASKINKKNGREGKVDPESTHRIVRVSMTDYFQLVLCLLFGLFPCFHGPVGHSSGRAPQPFSTDVLRSQMPPQQHFNQQTSVIFLPSYESYILCYLLSSTMKPMWAEQEDAGESQTLQSQY